MRAVRRRFSICTRRSAASTELLGLLDDDTFKHGKLFHGYPVLGSLDDLDAIMSRTPFDEISDRAGDAVGPATGGAREIRAGHKITLRRFMLGVTDITAPTISDRQLTTA